MDKLLIIICAYVLIGCSHKKSKEEEVNDFINNNKTIKESIRNSDSLKIEVKKLAIDLNVAKYGNSVILIKK